ncbi:hypothetical protein HNQ91_003278 [Filimonas zeae]|uniref:hypothetical protein n=1 Tax=Filimonas zeae TaxID=1737353 RepID=UPI001662C1FC|nr:hypothetical protein [Filimonas zeae]MDR6340213.1 hypothetical protein [Filimonas zeae]
MTRFRRFYICAITVALCASACNTSAQNKPARTSQTEAVFPGGQLAFRRFADTIIDTLMRVDIDSVPPEAFHFTANVSVDSLGVVTAVEIQAPIREGVKKYIAELFKKTPRWQPALAYGRPVASVWKWHPRICFAEE